MDIRETVEKLVAAGASEEEIDVVIQAYGKEQGPKTTGLGALVTGAGQAAFGLGDEAAAGAGALYDYATGQGDLSSSYDRRLKQQRSYLDAAAKENPGWYYGGLIGGSLAIPMSGPGRLASLGAQRLGSAGLRRLGVAGSTPTSLSGRMAGGALEGAAYGAAAGAGASEGGAQARLEGGLGGAALGGTIGGVAPAAISAGGGLIGAVKQNVDEYVKPIVSPQSAAVERVAGAIKADRAMPREMTKEAATLVRQGRAGQELMRVDRGENTRALARSAANQSPQARAILNEAIDPRYEGQYSRVSGFLRGITGNKAKAFAEREVLLDRARRINAANYRPLFDQTRGQVITNPTIENLQETSSLFSRAMKMAEKRAGDRAAADGLSRPSGVRDLQYWDYVKRTLDNMATRAYRNGDKDTGSIAGSMAKQLRESLDDQIKAYGNARSQAEAFFKADNALEAGENFARGLSGYSPDEVSGVITNMSPKEFGLFTQGFVSRLDDMMAKADDRRNLSRFLSKSPEMRKRISHAIGPAKAKEMEAFVNLEQIMQATKEQLQGNSTTARQLAEMSIGGLGGGYLYGGNPLNDPAGFITGMLIGGVGGRAAGSARMAQTQQMQKKIAELLVEQGDFDKVMKLAAKLSKQPKVMNNLREMVRRLSIGPTTVAAGAVGAQEGVTDAP